MRRALTIVSFPGRCGGAPTIGDSRLPLAMFVQLVRDAEGQPPRKRKAAFEALAEGYPQLTADDWRMLRAIASALG